MEAPFWLAEKLADSGKIANKLVVEVVDVDSGKRAMLLLAYNSSKLVKFWERPLTTLRKIVWKIRGVAEDMFSKPYIHVVRLELDLELDIG